MTISNSNLLFSVSMNPAMPGEGMMAGQMDVKSVNPKAQDQSSNGTDFWAMLNQQLADLKPQDDLQVTENTDLFSLFGVESEPGADADGDATGMAAEWMYSLQGNLSEQEALNTEPEALPADILEAGEDTADNPVMFIAANTADTAMPGGEELPPLRQVSSISSLEGSTLDPLSLNRKNNAQAVSPVAGDSIDVEVDMIDGDIDAKRFTLRNAEAEIKQEQFDNEKLQLKQSANEQAVQGLKDNSNAAQMQGNPPATTLSQTPSSQPLPSSLQAMQLSPQAPASAWGDALGERVSFLFNHKLNSAEIRLDPPHLGKLDIQIQLKDDSATVVIHTQHAHTRDLIDSASVRLREFLQEAGYSSVDVNVSHRDQSMGQDGFAQDDGSNTANDSADRQSLSDDSAGLQHAEISIASTNGRIDYFA